MIAKEYNVDEIEMRILNGDGAAWIKHGIDDTVHYQLDPFHKHQAILRSVRDAEQRKLKELYSYFKENRDGLIPYQERGLDILEPPLGLEYRNLGTMEHHICDIIAQRMKHRKASWSIEGASNLGKLLAAKASRRLNKVVERFSKIVLPEEKTYEIIQITNGRKAIRSMFNMRNFTDLVYR